MKKLILIAIIATVSLSAYSESYTADYVVTKDGISYFTKVRFGANAFLICKNENGEKVRYNKSEIISYRKAGEVFHKKTLIIKGKPCENCEFMKLLKTQHGFSIFMHQEYVNGGIMIKRFYVFNNDKFVLEINQQNLLQMLTFFKEV